MEDPYEYESYCMEAYEEGEGPPLLHTRSRLIAAVVQNNVNVLRDLLEPRWYNVTDSYGYNLLQIAICLDNNEAFDYILSLEDFPFNFVSKTGDTAIMLSLYAYVSNDIPVSSHFAHELIKKDVEVNAVTPHGDTLLHCAIERTYPQVVLLLLQKGVDVHKRNRDGLTALRQVLREYMDDVTELVAALLVHGADPFDIDDQGYNLFECGVLSSDSLLVHELLFLYTYETATDFTIHFDVILKLAKCNPDLLLRFIDRPTKVIIEDTKVVVCADLLLSNDNDNLNLIINKYANFVRHVLLLSNDVPYQYWIRTFNSVSIRNLDILLESELRTHTINYIQRLNDTPYMYNLVKYTMTEETATQVYIFLLSYGLNVSEFEMQLIYHNFGFCELFRIMLHMDIIMDLGDRYQKHALACLMYDVRLNFKTICLRCENYCDVHELLHYFADSRLKGLCQLYATMQTNCNPSILALIEHASTFPSLQELARNKFREYLMKRFKLKKAKDFYTLLKRIPISSHYKKIITYETKLYTLRT